MGSGYTTMGKATYTGVDNIMNGFRAVADDKPWYSVWHTTTVIAFSYNENDFEKGEQRLLENLQALEQAGNNDLIYIRFHPEKAEKFITNKTPVVACITARCNEVAESKYVPLEGGNNYKLDKALDKLEGLPAAIESKLSGIESRIAALENGEKDNEPQDLLGQITGILNNEPIMQLVTGLIGRIFQQPQPQQMAINGVPHKNQGNTKIVMDNTDAVSQQSAVTDLPKVFNQDAFDNALDRLEKHCELDTDLPLLADMAENNPTMFKMLLTQLRAK